MASSQTQTMIVDTFKKFDQNQDGKISFDELKRVLQVISNGQFSGDEIKALLNAADANQDGFISYEEFVQWVTKDMDSGTSFRPIDKRGQFQVNYRKLLPERFQVDVAERYKLDSLTLGEGGFGKVFVARDAEMSNRMVAVKKLQKPRRSSGASELNDLQKEIAVMKEMDHPGICKLLATFEEGQNVFFIMELCEGGELFDRIVDSGFINESFASIVVKQVASALAYAHGRGIAHRDIKPENVVFCTKDKNDHRVKLIDWGLATSFTGGDSMTKAVGSMTYAAPEVIASQDRKVYTEACDLWSLGVLTYVMLCGKPPFWGTREQHYRAAKNERYPFKDDPWDKMNPQAKDFVQKLLKADPAKRMNCSDACAHEWLKSAPESFSACPETSATVMNSLKAFAGQSTFTRLCITAVARQLDHKHLKDIHQVFQELDKDGNGVLSIAEVKEGIGKLGAGEGTDVDKLFSTMDIDGSKQIDYTEFCAAAMGERATNQDDIIWAAFKTFDVDNTGDLTVDNIKAILDNSDMQDSWSPEVCREVGMEVIKMFDKDGDGRITFDDFKSMMTKCWTNTQEKSMDALSILNKVSSLNFEDIK